ARADFGTCLEMRAALASERIPCLLVREPQDPAATRAQQRAAPVDLYVEVGRVEDAARVLHAKWQGLLQNEGLEPAAPATPDEETLHCPACGAAVAEDATECPDCGLGLGSANE